MSRWISMANWHTIRFTGPIAWLLMPIALPAILIKLTIKWLLIKIALFAYRLGKGQP